MMSRTPLSPRSLRWHKEAAPALEILLLTLGDTEDLPVTVRADANRHQHREVLHIARSAALEDHAVQVQVRELPDDLPVAPGLDVPVDLLVEPRDRARAHPRAPQRLGDVFDSSH